MEKALLLLLILLYSDLAMATEPYVYTNRDIESNKQENNQKSKAKLTNVTVDFKDAELQGVLHFLAKIAGERDGIDVTISPNIRGKTTIYAKSVSWASAIRMLLDKHNLAWTKKDNTIFVANKQELEQVVDQAEIRMSMAPPSSSVPFGKFKWIKIHSDNINEISLNERSVRSMSKDIKGVLVKNAYLRTEYDDTQKKFKDYEIAEVHLNCKAETFWTKSLLNYYSDGTTHYADAERYMMDGWHEIEPNSPIGKIFMLVCYNKISTN